MTEQFHRLYERVKKANDAQKGLYKKVSDYNEGISQMRNNLQSIIKPTEEIKDQVKYNIVKQEQVKSVDKSYLKDKLELEKKRHDELLAKQEEIINKKT